MLLKVSSLATTTALQFSLFLSRCLEKAGISRGDAKYWKRDLRVNGHSAA